eukprot:gene4346-16133_t
MTPLSSYTLGGVPCTPATVLSCDPAPSSGKVPVPDPTQTAKAEQRTIFGLAEALCHAVPHPMSAASQNLQLCVFNPSSWSKLPDILNAIIDGICP